MLENGKILGPFRIEQELGSGAMGTVFKATYTETGQPVAIKVIAFGLVGNETALARFEREAEILKQLNHPHIVRLYATGRYRKTPFFAMEFVKGEALDRILERRDRLGWQEVVQLGKQLCQALQHAHEKGIIHRDLKPSNLMILKDGTLKLTDFGIAKDQDVTALTNANSTVGTAAYMSPEQCKGERNLTAKSDLYSLGVVLYELLTGEKPFKKDSPVDMFMAHVTEPFERPSRKVLDIPPWLDTLVCQLMEKKPEHRPFDAAMVGRVLGEVETKMAEQHSAGLDAAKARIVDKPGVGAVDAADRYVAKVLRGAAKNKKVRIKSKPFWEKSWFLGVSIPAALACMGWFVWLLLQPPTVSEFYKRADAAVKAGKNDLAREICREFIAAHPASSDANAEQLRLWQEQFEAQLLDHQMQRRLNADMTAKDEGETLVRAAMYSENAGEIKSAVRNWEYVGLAFLDATTTDDKAFGWLAKQKIAALTNLKNREAELANMKESKDIPKPIPELLAWEGVHLEALEDYAAARERWTRLKDQFHKDLDARNFCVMASVKLGELKDKGPTNDEAIREARRRILEASAKTWEDLIKKNTPESRRLAGQLASDVAHLYGDSTDDVIKKIAEEALACLQKLRQ